MHYLKPLLYAIDHRIQDKNSNKATNSLNNMNISETYDTSLYIQQVCNNYNAMIHTLTATVQVNTACNHHSSIYTKNLSSLFTKFRNIEIHKSNIL